MPHIVAFSSTSNTSLVIYLSSVCNLVSHSALFGYFRTLFTKDVPQNHHRAGKAPTFKHFPDTTGLQIATHCCTSCNFEHYLCCIAASACNSVSHFALFGYFQTLFTKMFRKTTIELEKHPPSNTFSLYPPIFTATRMFRACFHS